MTVTDVPERESAPQAAVTTPKPDSVSSLAPTDPFPRRHIGPGPQETKEMLKIVGYDSLEALVDDAIPRQIRLNRSLQLPPGRSEHEVLSALREIASQNQVARSYIGMGYYDCVTPAVIQRNILESP